MIHSNFQGSRKVLGTFWYLIVGENQYIKAASTGTSGVQITSALVFTISGFQIMSERINITMDGLRYLDDKGIVA
jgi:hypothetical protein